MKKTSFTLLFLLVFSLLNAQNNCLDFDGTDDYVNCRAQPTLSSTVSCNNLAIGSSSALIVSSNTLTNTGDVLNEGTITVSGTLINNGTSSTFINNGILIDDGTVILRNLTNNSGKTVDINEVKEMTINGDLDNSGTMTINSSTSGTGSLITNGAVTGLVNAERYIAAWGDPSHGWHELSSPVNNMVIAGSDFVPGTNDDLYKWDEVQNLWLNYKVGANNITNFTNGEGYLVAYQTTATKTFTGTLNNADVPKSNLTYTVASAHTGWHLLGNPYPCALYWNKTGWGLTNIDATAKIWVESSASYTDISAVTGIIPAMQGFMVHVTASGTGSLTIPTTDRTHSSTSWYKEEDINKIILTAYDPEGSTAQESIIRFNKNATTGFDSEYDSRFLSGYAPLFYSATSYGNLSTNTLPEITAELTIQMNFIRNASSTFYIEAEGVNNLIPQETVYLTDLKTNHTQNLNENAVYSFTSAEGDEPARFLIHFSPVGIENPAAIANRINIFSYMNNLYVQCPAKCTIEVFNLAGQLISKEQNNSKGLYCLSHQFNTGNYIVRVIGKQFVETGKIFIK